MDEEAFEAATERLKEVDKVIKGLDPAIRESAFDVLKPYVGTGTLPGEVGSSGGGNGGSGDGSGSGANSEGRSKRLLEENAGASPADNAVMCAAIWFDEYGKSPFTYEDIRGIANDLGVTISERLDNAINSAKRNGKKLFKAAGKKGTKAPTTHGELYFKEKYGVTQGSKTPPGAS